MILTHCQDIEVIAHTEAIVHIAHIDQDLAIIRILRTTLLQLRQGVARQHLVAPQHMSHLHHIQ